MGLILDGVLIVIILLNVILGYKKGLVNAIFNIVAFLLAIIIAFFLYRPVTNMVIDNTEIVDKVQSIIIKNQNDDSQENNQEENMKKENENIAVKSYIKSIGESAKGHSIEVISREVAIKIVNIGVAIILFIISRIILMIFKILIEGVVSLPVIKQFNHAGGFFYGLLKGLIIVYVLLTILFFIVSVKENGAIANAIESSTITKFLYNNNVILKYCFLNNNLL